MNHDAEGQVDFTQIEDAKTAEHVSDSVSPIGAARATSDDVALERLGKKPVLKRNFGFWPSFGFSCTLLITWEGVLCLFASGINNGGPAGVIYGYILVWIGTLSVFAALAELASMAPISGGQYHWVAMLSPPSCQRFLGYVTGWFTFFGWQAEVASAAYLSGTMIQGLIVLCNPDTYQYQNWHGTLLFWAVVLVAVLINTVVSAALPKFEGFTLILHIVGFFAVLIPLVVLGPHDTAESVFTSFINGGAWPTNGVSFFVGLLGNVFAFFGADGAIHMSEEIRNAAVVVPRSIVAAIVFNGILGFAITIALLFCLGDPEAALASETRYPFMEVFQNAVHSTAGATIMSAIVMIMACCATVAMLASASRVFWSFARDRAVPGWAFFSKVDRRTSIPLNAVALASLVAVILSLINIGSATAFNDIISLTVSALFSSYLIAASLLLWRRLRGEIKTTEETSSSLANTPGSQLVWGPWRIPGLLGIINNVFAVAFLIVILFFSFWPPATPVDPSTMNWSSMILGVVFIFSVLYYVIWARKTYIGPIVETKQIGS